MYQLSHFIMHKLKNFLIFFEALARKYAKNVMDLRNIREKGGYANRTAIDNCPFFFMRYVLPLHSLSLISLSILPTLYANCYPLPFAFLYSQFFSSISSFLSILTDFQ